MKRFMFRSLMMTVVIGAAAFTVGCQDKLTHEHFSQIRPNASSQREVELIIGEPDEMVQDVWLWSRPDKHLTVKVDFNERGLVSRKQWIDGRTGTWEDSEPEKEGQSSSQTIRMQKSD